MSAASIRTLTRQRVARGAPRTSQRGRTLDSGSAARTIGDVQSVAACCSSAFPRRVRRMSNRFGKAAPAVRSAIARIGVRTQA